MNSKREHKKQKCILCKKTFEGHGNNPYPFADFNDGVCCDECNYSRVIPARLSLINWKK